jgi:hypothetical protein
MSASSVDAARRQREELKSQIRLLTQRSGQAERHLEELGIPRESDRVADLRRHLSQVESFLAAAHENPEVDVGWFMVETPSRSGASAGEVLKPAY